MKGLDYLLMARKIETKNYKDPTTFGGIIYQSDFNTLYGVSVSDRIFNDLKFDKQCKKNVKKERKGN